MDRLMKNILQLLFLLTSCCILEVFSQVDTVWVKKFDGPQHSSDAARIVKVDENGFIYVGGSVSVIPGYGSFALIKYNQNGDTLWVRYYNSPINHTNSLNDMVIDKNGNIILTGISEGAFYNDYATVKYDPDGNLLWVRRYDDGDIDNAYAIVTDDLLNVYVTGSSWKVYQTDNIVTIKYNKDGDTLWTYFYNGYEDAMAVGKGYCIR
jgi:hypothetical protein